MHPSMAIATPNEDLTLAIVFDSGEEGILDIRPYMDFWVFQRIKEYADYKQIRIAFDAIEWDRGVDLDSEFIYSKCRYNPRAVAILSERSGDR